MSHTVTIPAALTDRLDAYAAEQGLNRDEAAAHLVDVALRIGNLDHTLDSLNNQAMETLFADVWGDRDAFLLELHENCADSYGEIESNDKNFHDDLSDDLPDIVIEMGIYHARGQWIIEITYHQDGNITYEWEIATDKADATRRYTEHVQALTDQYWSPGQFPLWGEGVDGDYLGLSPAIKWRGLLPDGSVWEDGKHRDDYLNLK